MKKFFYIEVSEEFAATNNGYAKGACIFNAVQTKEGEWVTNVNALNEFPELFEGVEIGAPIALSPEDFKTEEENGS